MVVNKRIQRNAYGRNIYKSCDDDIQLRMHHVGIYITVNETQPYVIQIMNITHYISCK